MSASREKKSRQSDPTQGLTQKERKELQEQQAAKRKVFPESSASARPRTGTPRLGKE